MYGVVRGSKNKLEILGCGMISSRYGIFDAEFCIRVLVGSQDVRVNLAGTKGRASHKIKTCYGAV